MTVRTIVVAKTVDRARTIVAERNLGRSAIAVSPRSVRFGAGRGHCGVTAILVDGTAWPLGDDVLAELMPTTFASPSEVVPTLLPPPATA